MPFLNQRKGENDRRKYFMINLYERMLPTLLSVAMKYHVGTFIHLGPVVQSVVSLTSSLRVILLTVLADSVHNILIFFAEKM